MKNFDKSTCREFRKDLESILAILEDQHNIKIELGKITFSNSSARLTLTANCANEDGTILSKDEKAYIKVIKNSNRMNELLYGFFYFKDLHDTFDYQGTVFEIIGFKPRNKKYPLLAKSLKNSKTYKFQAYQAKKDFKKSK